MGNIKIQASQIPDIEMRIFTHHFMKVAEAYFEDPVHKKEFEEWQRNRQKASCQE